MEQGVWYHRQDYAGIWRRCLAWGVDLALLCLLSFGIAVLVDQMVPDLLRAWQITFWAVLFLCYLYLAVLKPSSWRTPGFRAADLKIVDLAGERPSWITMLVRFLLLCIGPFTLVIDLLWLTGEPTRQTLRDKYMGTYVVRNGATPAGTGVLRKISLDFLGWHLLFREVVGGVDQDPHRTGDPDSRPTEGTG